MERVLIGGDLSKLSAPERLVYYKAVCESVGLNPLTKPFEYILLNGKLTLYARKDATDQLRSLHDVSITNQTDRVIEGIYVVTTYVQNAKGRTDVAKGAVHIENLKGEARANAIMKAETKSKRRATLSICGLGMLDETEVESIPQAVPAKVITSPAFNEPAHQAAFDVQAPPAVVEAEPVPVAGEVPLIGKPDLLKVIKLTERMQEYGATEESWRDQLEKITGQRSRKLIEQGDVGAVLIALSTALNALIKAKGSKGK